MVNKEDKQENVAVEDNSDKTQENDKCTRDANQKKEELEHTGNNETKTESSEVVDKTLIAGDSSVQDTEAKNIVKVENENLRVNSMEENSDDVFEENYESCDEGEEPGQDKSENAISDQTVTKDIESVENTKSSSDINNVAIENAQNAVKVEVTESKKDNSSNNEANANKSLDTNSENMPETTKNNTERTAGDEYEDSQQDMRNIERPSLSGSED